MRVMDEGPVPPAVGVNVNVTETPDLPATRSTSAIANATAETALIEPEETEVDAVGSALVCTVI